MSYYDDTPPSYSSYPSDASDASVAGNPSDAHDDRAERRQERRLGCNVRVTWWKSTGFHRNARLVNVSHRGALMRLSPSLVSRRRVTIGETLLLRVRFRGSTSGPMKVTAIVRWVGSSKRFAAMVCGLQITGDDAARWSEAVATFIIPCSESEATEQESEASAEVPVELPAELPAEAPAKQEDRI